MNELMKKLELLEEKVKELEERVAGASLSEYGATDEEVKQACDFLCERGKEEFENAVREHCGKNNLNPENAADYARAAGAVLKESDYNWGGLFGSGVSPWNRSDSRATSTALRDVGKVLRDRKRLQRFDREMNQIQTYLDNHGNTGKAQETARKQMFKTIDKYKPQFEHPSVRGTFNNAFGTFNNVRPFTSFNSVKKAFEDRLDRKPWMRKLAGI